MELLGPGDLVRDLLGVHLCFRPGDLRAGESEDPSCQRLRVLTDAGKVLLRRKAIQLRKETGDSRYKAPIEVMDRTVAQTVLWSCIRPFQLLVLEPMVFNLVSDVSHDLSVRCLRSLSAYYPRYCWEFYTCSLA